LFDKNVVPGPSEDLDPKTHPTWTIAVTIYSPYTLPDTMYLHLSQIHGRLNIILLDLS